MNGKLTSETIRQQLKTTGPLLLAYILLFLIIDTSTLNIYAYTIFYMLLIASGVLCIASIVMNLYKTFITDLLLGKSYRFYSLPLKKSTIIFSKAIPTIVIQSIAITLIANAERISNLYACIVGVNESEYSKQELIHDELLWLLNDSCICFITSITIGFLILLAFVLCRSFDPSKTLRNFIIATAIEFMAYYSVLIVIANITSDLHRKVYEVYEANPGFTFEQSYERLGVLMYYEEILLVIILILALIEIIGVILASKKLANTKFNVL